MQHRTMAMKTILTAALLLAASAAAQTRPSADLIVTNGKLYTVDKARPRAEALAIIGSRIVAVGSVPEIDAWRGPGTRILDAHEHLVLPGFNDAHVHFIDGGIQLDSVDLKSAASPEEFAKRIADRAKTTPAGEWITGGNWDEQKWNPPQLPTRQMLDAAVPDKPVFVTRYDGHMGVGNSLALKLSRITPESKDPPGGAIVRDTEGVPTGVLKDAAMDAVSKAMPVASHERLLRAAKRALAYAAYLGITSIQEMANPDEDLGQHVRVYKELGDRGELTARIYVAPNIFDWENQAKVGVRRAFGSSYLRIGAVKAYADGSLGSSTAYFFEPYSDDPKNRGLLGQEMQPLSKMREWLLKSDASALQICMHAIGDQANSVVLDLFQQVQQANGVIDRRWRIEHAQHIAPKDFDRFAKLNVVASVQPYHAIDDGRWAEKRIGAERVKTTYAFRTFLQHGIKLAVGTDWTVAPFNPMLTLYAAVTRATLDGKNPEGWGKEQKLSLAEAIEAYTMGSAFAEFQENEKGSLTPGKLADLVILSDDLFSIDPKNIPDVHVDTTVVGGKVVWSRQ